MPEIRMPIGGGTPPTPASGEVSLYAKPDKRFYMQDDTGAEIKLLTNEATLTDVTVTAPLTTTGGASPTLAINNVTTVANGAMLAADKLKLDQATNTNTANTIVRRDPLGNFSAGTITASQFNGPATSVTTIPALTGDVTSDGNTNAVSITPGVIVNADISNTAAIALSKLAVDPLNRANHTGFQNANTLSNLGTEIDSHLTANAPIVNAMINNSAAIDLSKLAVNPLNRSNHTGTQAVATISDFTSEVNATVGTYLTNNPITNSEIDALAAIDLSKLAVNPLSRANHTGTQTASTISDFNSAVELAFTAGDGIDITTGTISALGTLNRIDTSGGTINISSAYVGQSSITTLGTITSGSWNGGIVGVAYGGTGSANTGAALNNLTTVETINAGATLNDSDRVLFVNATSASITIALPAADNTYEFVIKKIDSSANTVTINADPGDLIEGSASYTLTTQYDYVRLISDETTNWFVISG
jgi:hypothetical protein